MAKKEVGVMKADNSFGVSAVIMGILSIVLASGGGIVLGIIGLYFSWKQKNVMRNKWSKAGFILNSIGIVLSIVAIIITVKYAASVIGQLPGGY